MILQFLDPVTLFFILFISAFIVISLLFIGLKGYQELPKTHRDYSEYLWASEPQEKQEGTLSNEEFSNNTNDTQIESIPEILRMPSIDPEMEKAISLDSSELPLGKYGIGWLKPIKKSPFLFNLSISGMYSLEEKSRFDESAEYIFKEAVLEIPRKGYYLVSSDYYKKNGIFKGKVMGFAEIKSSEKKVGLIIEIVGSVHSEGCVVTITAYCKDESVLPIEIEDFEQSLWQ